MCGLEISVFVKETYFTELCTFTEARFTRSSIPYKLQFASKVERKLQYIYEFRVRDLTPCHCLEKLPSS
jgi:hypothetical protein